MEYVMDAERLFRFLRNNHSQKMAQFLARVCDGITKHSIEIPGI